MCMVWVPRHKTDDPWGAFLETHDVPQGNTVYIPYGEGGPDVVAAAHDGGTTMSLNGVHDGGVTAPAPAPTTVLGAGPEVYNNFSASQNCVGGSETSCIPEHPPVGDPSKTGPDRHPIKPSVCEPTHDGHICVQPPPQRKAQTHRVTHTQAWMCRCRRRRPGTRRPRTMPRWFLQRKSQSWASLLWLRKGARAPLMRRLAIWLWPAMPSLLRASRVLSRATSPRSSKTPQTTPPPPRPWVAMSSQKSLLRALPSRLNVCGYAMTWRWTLDISSPRDRMFKRGRVLRH